MARAPGVGKTGEAGRRLRPRANVSPAAIAVSQLTVLAMTGIDPRRFLELMRQHAEVPRARVGKLVVVELGHLMELLGRLALDPAASNRFDADDDAGGDDDDDQPSDVDSELARLGRKRAG